MAEVNNTASIAPQRAPEASNFIDTRLKAGIVLGTAVLLTVAPEAWDKVNHEVDTMRQQNAVEEVRLEETPAALAYAHNQIGQNLDNADAIAKRVVNSESERIELVKGAELEMVFGSDMVEGDKLIIDNTTFFVKYAFSKNGKNHLVVANRIISEDTNPQIIGSGEDRTSALQDAANKISKGQVATEAVASADAEGIVTAERAHINAIVDNSPIEVASR